MNQIQQDHVNEIRTLHNEILASARTTLEKAIEIGRHLVEVKASLAYGLWGKWVTENLPFTTRTARRYVAVYEHRDELTSDSVSELASAYRLLAAPHDEDDDQCAQQFDTDAEMDSSDQLVDAEVIHASAEDDHGADAERDQHTGDAPKDWHNFCRRFIMFARKKLAALHDVEEARQLLDACRWVAQASAEIAVDAEAKLGEFLSESWIPEVGQMSTGASGGREIILIHDPAADRFIRLYVLNPKTHEIVGTRRGVRLDRIERQLKNLDVDLADITWNRPEPIDVALAAELHDLLTPERSEDACGAEAV